MPKIPPFTLSAEEEQELFDEYAGLSNNFSENTTKHDHDDSIAHSVRMHDQSSYTPSSLRATLTWANLTVTLASGKTVINDITGLAKPGELLAVMGESGAGKTTFLNLVGGRALNQNLNVRGDIRMNGVPLELKIVRNYIGFVYQDDIFPSKLTVSEYMWFNSKLRMGADTNDDEVSLYLLNLSYKFVFSFL